MDHLVEALVTLCVKDDKNCDWHFNWHRPCVRVHVSGDFGEIEMKCTNAELKAWKRWAEAKPHRVSILSLIARLEAAEKVCQYVIDKDCMTVDGELVDAWRKAAGK